MTTISIAYEVPAATVEAIRVMLDEVARTDVNWNGADFKIVRDDFTSIEEESYDAAALLNKINDVIDGK
ncbi:hypothetical protein [Pseudomonas sp. LRF_L74]|uniref:hypothetical protein n=1 Tax=Pseudomonas sp. LRF_L74 TaxID=3369422 RepID=UPI003F6406F7